MMKLFKNRTKNDYKKISDVIYNMAKNLSHLRKLDKKKALQYIDELDTFVRDYFKNSDLDVLELKKLTVDMVDALYCQMTNLAILDIHTRGYIGIVLNRLFFNLTRNNIRIFFIIDNNLRDDRFSTICELFIPLGFAVVHPYVIKDASFALDYTKYKTVDSKTIEKHIDDAKSQNKHILYIEKDDSVNYLSNALSQAEEFQNEYVCVFRNGDPTTNKKATWLLGSFSGLLNN